MAKRAYIGVDGIARRSRKGFVGADGFARRIRTAYIGIDGVARPCWNCRELTYYGKISAIDPPRSYARMASNTQYTLLAGGITDTSVVNIADAFDKNLTKVSAPSLSSNRSLAVGVTIGEYALFAGGYLGSDFSTTQGSVAGNYTGASDAYTDTLTKTSASYLSPGRAYHAGATANNLALFGGGLRGTTAQAAVDAYTETLTHSTAASLSVARGELAAAGNTAYILFGGGSLQDGTASAAVDAYDAGLTRTTPEPLSAGRRLLSGTSSGRYAIFGGNSTSVDGYDEDLTRISASPLPNSNARRGTARFDEYGMFVGGGYSDKRVISYDADLIQTIHTSLTLSANFSGTSGASIGSFVLVYAGGATQLEAYTFV